MLWDDRDSGIHGSRGQTPTQNIKTYLMLLALVKSAFINQVLLFVEFLEIENTGDRVEPV